MDNKIIVVGTYGIGITVSDGQINKVRGYYRYIRRRFGSENVKRVDLGAYKAKPISTLAHLYKSIIWSDKILLLLCGDGNGIKVILPPVIRLSKLYKKQLYLSVVGGGMLNGIEKKKKLIEELKQIDAIYVETRTMKRILNKKGLTNVFYAPVFSKRKGININDVKNEYQEPLRMCTYARVIKEKGISDAIDAVIDVNERFGKMVCVLDIYGDPKGDYKTEFEEKVRIAGECVKCNALLDDLNAIKELSKHYLLLFPTYYQGEGFPIALVESMKAGLPVVATDWHFNAEIIDNGRTGIIYKRDGSKSLSDILFELINDRELVSNMRIECIKESEKYDPNSVLSDLYKRLER